MQQQGPVRFEDKEAKLVEMISKKFRTLDRDELRTELFRTLLNLKTTHRPDIRDWEAYLAGALHHRASNIVRNWRGREKRIVYAPDVSREECLHPVAPDAAPDIERRLMMEAARAELDPRLQKLWDLLATTESLSEVARAMGKHRNTIRAWIKELRRVLEKHGL